MDEELKQYLDRMAADLMNGMQQIESRIVAALQSRERPLDAVSRKLEGLDTATEPENSRTEAGR